MLLDRTAKDDGDGFDLDVGQDVILLNDAVAEALRQLSDGVPTAGASTDGRPSPADAMCAVLLDAAGIVPNSLTRHAYLTLLRVPHGGAGLFVAFLSSVLPGATTNNYSAQRGILVTKYMGRGTDFLTSAMSHGSGVVLVVEAGDKLDEAVEKFIDKEIRVSDAEYVELKRIVELVTGAAVDLPYQAHYTVAEILGCVRTGSDADAVVERLQRIVQAETTSTPDDTVAPSAPTKSVVKLSDLSGYGAAKDWGMQLAADLNDYADGTLAWDDVDRGILLSGPPGCGKTYFARALAAECGVELISCSYTEMEASIAGGNLIAKAIKKIFADARKKAPCIVFIDELDSVGNRADMDHNSSWFTIVINALLAELDGAEPRDGVVVIGATNLPDRIDAALKRPGRLERHVVIPAPGIEDIKGIIKHHLPSASDLSDLPAAARACRGMSPADISLVCREARRVARTCKRDVCADDVYFVVKYSRQPQPDDEVAVVHESGHAFGAVIYGVGLDHVDADRRYVQTTFPGAYSASDLIANVRMTLAGRAAEEVLLDKATSGAMQDLEIATAMALKYHGSLGFGDFGLYHFGADSGRHPDIRRAAATLIDREYRQVKADFAANVHTLKRLVKRLRSDRYMTGAEVRAAVAPTVFDRHVPDTDASSWGPPSDSERSAPGRRIRMAA
jgi:AAA+ superfamily predicted ATPase